MKTLVTAIQKGGQGKTFATCHLAFDFLERGLRVAVIDLDTQGNASFTLSAYQSGYLASQLFTGDTDDLRYWFGKREGESLALIAELGVAADAPDGPGRVAELHVHPRFFGFC